MDVFYRSHARKRMVERGISASEVERAISRGSKHLQKPDRIIAGYGHIEVVYRIIDGKIFVITVQLRW